MALVFAMNAGMFKVDYSPKGLFIQNFKNLADIDTCNGTGNFYLKPNGVFYIDYQNEPYLCTTSSFVNSGKVKMATQSGPMLLIDGKINSSFTKNSSNLNVRNGVGILPNKKVIFAISKTEISFYEFSLFFKKLGCKNALYLDGFVSRAYMPSKNWIQTDGNFGAMFGLVEKKK